MWAMLVCTLRRAHAPRVLPVCVSTTRGSTMRDEKLLDLPTPGASVEYRLLWGSGQLRRIRNVERCRLGSLPFVALLLHALVMLSTLGHVQWTQAKVAKGLGVEEVSTLAVA